MRHNLLLSVALSAAALVMLLALLLLPASANAVVLVNAPSTTIRLGQRIESGVWYQSFSGGPRWAKITILAHNRRVVFSHRVTAAASHWKNYSYRPRRTDTYLLRYQTAQGQLSFRIRVRG